VPDLRLDKGKATRDRLITAARQLFGERGYEATSIEAVLDAAGAKRGSLYHHFAGKEELFDAVLDRLVASIAANAAQAARAAGTDPVANLRAGCLSWLRMALDPAVQRIVLVDTPVVLGWTRLRELDERHTLGKLRSNLARIAPAAGLPGEQVDIMANMLLAALNEAALLIVRATDQQAALATAVAAVDTLIDRLARPAPSVQGSGHEL
jgi:AcrR family transcriptional regulator